eukprot:gb/GECG01015930.1/.p1 GENE.gb/GECG01015930.1/~~gb/GECG01015930.1/.p1  ORF type:complete len:545 (+),score=44.94 gb/GECG01015930.1/:1-1635(+)
MLASWLKEYVPHPTPRTLRFSATTLGASMLSTLFYTYYIPLFLKTWGLTYGWFYTGQTLFLLWNAINDPLFGWLQDNPSAPKQDNIKSYSRAIYLGGPVFAFATLLPWWPWAEPFTNPTLTGIHFIVSLFMFDGLFTYVVLAQCGLFADIEESQEGRSDVVATSQLAQMIGSLTTFVSYPLWEKSNAGVTSTAASNVDLTGFRLLAIIVSFVAAACFYYTGRTEGTLEKQQQDFRQKQPASDGVPSTETATAAKTNDSGVKLRTKASGSSPDFSSATKEEDEKTDSLMTIYKQVISNANFLKFITVNFLQIFNNTFNGNFYAEFMTALFGSKDAEPLELNSQMRGMMLGATNFLPPLFTIFLTPVVKRLGHSYELVKTMFWVKLFGTAIVASIATPNTVAGLFVIAIFMVLHKSIAATTFSFFNMSVSDLIDDDMKRNDRKRRLGTTFFGLNALFTTPAVSAAPMITVGILSQYGYVDKSDPTGGGAAENSEYSHDLKTVMWTLIWAVPLICATLQLLVWSSYSLRGEQYSNGKTKDEEVERGP